MTPTPAQPTVVEDREALRALIHASARHLDDGAYDSFADLFAADGRYRVEVDAPELPRRMVWMELDRDQIRERCGGIDRHEWRIDQQTRLVSVDRVALADARATTSSSVAIYRTDEDGRTACYAVARYEDDWRRAGGRWRLAERVVALRTRLLAIPSPLPL